MESQTATHTTQFKFKEKAEAVAQISGENLLKITNLKTVFFFWLRLRLLQGYHYHKDVTDFAITPLGIDV